MVKIRFEVKMKKERRLNTMAVRYNAENRIKKTVFSIYSSLVIAEINTKTQKVIKMIAGII